MERVPEKRIKPMSKRRRKALLVLCGITGRMIAKGTGRNEHTVSTVLNHYPEKKSRVIQTWIAAHTNTTYERIWGNAPRTRRTKPPNNPTIAEDSQHCQ